jgi:glutaredoxin 3
MKNVIYSKIQCTFCEKAKTLMNTNDILYEEYILDSYGKDFTIINNNQHWVSKEQLLEVCPDAKTVPQIWLNDIHIGGYTELVKYLKENSVTFTKNEKE